MTGGGEGDGDDGGEEGCSSTITSAGRLSAVSGEVCVGEDGESWLLIKVEEEMVVEVGVGAGVAGSGGRWSKGGEAVVASSAAESARSMNGLLCDSKSSRDGRTLSRGLNPRPSMRFADYCADGWCEEVELVTVQCCGLSVLAELIASSSSGRLFTSYSRCIQQRDLNFVSSTLPEKQLLNSAARSRRVWKHLGSMHSLPSLHIP